MISITKIVEFEAAHHLPGHKGRCHNLHGHSYKLEVEVGGIINADGMIMDFGILKIVMENLVDDYFDHKNLNDTFINPTAEYMVEWIAFQLRKHIDESNLLRVRLWETSSSYAEWRTNET
jgi:6-pyruvoyltetrahydropterin/6-carboxytetrahydropterin synthase